MRCQCPACSDPPAPTYTEAFKRECLARWILGKDRYSRQKFYADFAKKHGEPAAQQLISDVKKEYERGRAPSASNAREQSGGI